MEAIVIGVINLLLFAGKFVWDWWVGKKEKEKLRAELEKRDRALVSMVLQRARRQGQDSNRGLVKMEDEVQAWLKRINES